MTEFENKEEFDTWLQKEIKSENDKLDTPNSLIERKLEDFMERMEERFTEYSLGELETDKYVINDKDFLKQALLEAQQEARREVLEEVYELISCEEYEVLDRLELNNWFNKGIQTALQIIKTKKDAK